MMNAGIALGSNLGDSKEVLLQAIEGLKKLHEGSPSSFLISSFHQTEPVDCPPGSPSFLNAVIQLETSLAPEVLLEILQKMEVAVGRPSPHAFHAPRILDLDFLYYGSLEFVSPVLEVPHPRIRERLFVLAPLAEIIPDLQLPKWEKTAGEYLQLLGK